MQIRVDFIKEYGIRDQKYKDKMRETLEERNRRFSQLNKKFNFSETDGTFSIGRKSYEPEYSESYEAIEIWFRPLYDSPALDLDSWMRSQTITIYEFMFLDNITLHNFEKILELLNQDKYVDLIQTRAENVVQKLIEKGENLEEIIRSLDFEKNSFDDFRCKKFFDIKFWDVSKLMEIRSYKSRYNRCLDKVVRTRKLR